MNKTGERGLCIGKREGQNNDTVLNCSPLNHKFVFYCSSSCFDLPSSARYTAIATIILLGEYFIEISMLKQIRHFGGLVIAVFQQQPAVWFQTGCAVFDDTADGIQAITA